MPDWVVCSITKHELILNFLLWGWWSKRAEFHHDNGIWSTAEMISRLRIWDLLWGSFTQSVNPKMQNTPNYQIGQYVLNLKGLCLKGASCTFGEIPKGMTQNTRNVPRTLCCGFSLCWRSLIFEHTEYKSCTQQTITWMHLDTPSRLQKFRVKLIPTQLPRE